MARAHEPNKGAAVVGITAAGRRIHDADPLSASQRQMRTAQRVTLLAALIAHRVPETLAHALADDAAKLGQGDDSRALAAALELRMRARPIDYVNANAILLKGIPGTGKTSVAAKIAAQAFLTGRNTKILTTDAAAPRLVDLAQRTKVKIVPGPTAQTIERAVKTAIARNGLVVVDTSGFNPRRVKARMAFEALGQIEGIETIGIVSALYDAAEIGELIFALAAQRTIVTGLDLARRAGALAVAATSGPPLAHVARSPFAGDGLEPLTPLALAQTLLGVRPDWQ
jgi:signal recognition particle GTPase